MPETLVTEDKVKRLEARNASLERQLHAMTQISNMIATKSTATDLLSDILDTAMQLFYARSGSVMLVDDTGQNLQVQESKGIEQDIISETVRIGESISGWVAQNCEPLLMIGDLDDPKFRKERIARHIKDAISVPLCSDMDVLGVLNISNSLEGHEFTDYDVRLLTSLGQQAAVALKKSVFVQQLDSSYIELASALARIVDARDPYTFGHSRAVRDYSMGIAENLDLPRAELRRLNIAAILHDIGKIAIKDEVLLKPSSLTLEEYKIIQTHSSIGARILETVPYLRDLAPIVRHHHERYDGTGYPSQLRGEEIPLGARIMAIADAFDAMASNRAYRKPLPMDMIMNELKKGRGKQFDSALLDIFLRAFSIRRSSEEAGHASILDMGQSIYHSGDKRFNLYDMLFETRPDEVTEALAILTEIVENVMLGLQQYVGGRAALIVEETINGYSKQNQLPYLISNGRMHVNMQEARLGDILKTYDGYHNELLNLVAIATGSHIADNIGSEAIGMLGEEKRAVYSQMFS